MSDENSSEDVSREANTDAVQQPQTRPATDQRTPPPPTDDTDLKNLHRSADRKKPVKQAQRWLIGVGIATLLINSIIALIYLGELREMTAATNASEQSAYAACISAQLARKTLAEIQAGGTDNHNLALGTLAEAAAVTHAEAAQIAVHMVGNQITSVDNDLSAPFEIKNIGNSNALNVKVESVIDVVDVGKEPTFKYDQSIVNIAETGSVNRGDDAKPFNFYKMKAGKRAKLSRGEEVQIGTGIKYVVAYGRVTYRDIFGVPHWATFCSHLQLPNQNGSPDQHIYDKCADYNAVDIAPVAMVSRTQSPTVSLLPEITCHAPK